MLTLKNNFDDNYQELLHLNEVVTIDLIGQVEQVKSLNDVRVIKYVYDNLMNHYKNYYKDNILPSIGDIIELPETVNEYHNLILKKEIQKKIEISRKKFKIIKNFQKHHHIDDIREINTRKKNNTSSLKNEQYKDFYSRKHKDIFSKSKYYNLINYGCFLNSKLIAYGCVSICSETLFFEEISGNDNFLKDNIESLLFFEIGKDMIENYRNIKYLYFSDRFSIMNNLKDFKKLIHSSPKIIKLLDIYDNNLPKNNLISCISSLYQTSNTLKDLNNIPKIINLSCKFKNNVPIELIAKWKSDNPDFEIRLHDDRDCIDFLKNNFNQGYVDHFNDCYHGSYKCDFWRACKMYKDGGVYADLDVVMTKPLDFILDNNNISLIVPSSVEKDCMNPLLIISEPKHPIMKECIDRILERKKLYSSNSYFWRLSICPAMRESVLKLVHDYQDNIDKDYILNGKMVRILKDPCIRGGHIQWNGVTTLVKNQNWDHESSTFIDVKVVKIGFDLDEYLNHFNHLNTTYNGGFFCCCSFRLYDLIEYINCNNKTPITVDSSRQFELYKNDNNVNITYEYFDHYDNQPNIFFDKKLYIKYHWQDQFKDYSKIDYKNIVPIINKYFSPSENINNIKKTIEDKYNLQYDNTCVLFYRGNDKNYETKICEYKDYLIYSDLILSKNPKTLFLIQSDETGFITFMRNKYPKNSFYFKDEIRHIEKKNTSVDLEMKSSNHKFSQFYLAITFIMSKCKYIICGSGNCSIWIILFRGNNNNVFQNLNNTWYLNNKFTVN